MKFHAMIVPRKVSETKQKCTKFVDDDLFSVHCRDGGNKMNCIRCKKMVACCAIRDGVAY